MRTGVDTAFVAPVDIGDGAYTGAGSVITEDVPEGALGMARSKQTNIEGFADRDNRDAIAITARTRSGIEQRGHRGRHLHRARSSRPATTSG
ncbi:MAG: hypothetical protein WKF40_03990 [Thermoleophilaceae bacterium]